jgi:hypothetical protein
MTIVKVVSVLLALLALLVMDRLRPVVTGKNSILGFSQGRLL